MKQLFRTNEGHIQKSSNHINSNFIFTNINLSESLIKEKTSNQHHIIKQIGEGDKWCPED